MSPGQQMGTPAGHEAKGRMTMSVAVGARIIAAAAIVWWLFACSSIRIGGEFAHVAIFGAGLFVIFIAFSQLIPTLVARLSRPNPRTVGRKFAIASQLVAGVLAVLSIAILPVLQSWWPSIGLSIVTGAFGVAIAIGKPKALHGGGQQSKADLLISTDSRH